MGLAPLSPGARHSMMGAVRASTGVPPAPGQAGNLPGDLSTFVGRRREIRDVKRLLRSLFRCNARSV